MTQHTEQKLIDAYLNYYRMKNEEFWWAWKEVDKKRSSDDLEFVFKLIQECRGDSEIAYVAAGPLRDLFIAQHAVIKEKLSIMVRQHKNMRKAIQALILSAETPEKKTLDEILNKYGLHHASL